MLDFYLVLVSRIQSIKISKKIIKTEYFMQTMRMNKRILFFILFRAFSFDPDGGKLNI
jgi:hypothetical protein